MSSLWIFGCLKSCVCPFGSCAFDLCITVELAQVTVARGVGLTSLSFSPPIELAPSPLFHAVFIVFFVCVACRRAPAFCLLYPQRVLGCLFFVVSIPTFCCMRVAPAILRWLHLAVPFATAIAFEIGSPRLVYRSQGGQPPGSSSRLLQGHGTPKFPKFHRVRH